MVGTNYTGQERKRRNLFRLGVKLAVIGSPVYNEQSYNSARFPLPSL